MGTPDRLSDLHPEPCSELGRWRRSSWTREAPYNSPTSEAARSKGLETSAGRVQHLCSTDSVWCWPIRNFCLSSHVHHLCSCGVLHVFRVASTCPYCPSRFPTPFPFSGQVLQVPPGCKPLGCHQGKEVWSLRIPVPLHRPHPCWDCSLGKLSVLRDATVTRFLTPWNTFTCSCLCYTFATASGIFLFEY